MRLLMSRGPGWSGSRRGHIVCAGSGTPDPWLAGRSVWTRRTPISFAALLASRARPKRWTDPMLVAGAYAAAVMAAGAL